MEPIKLQLHEIEKHPNVAELLDKEQQEYIANECWEGYRADRFSRNAWEEQMSDAIKLALQVVTEKSFPWPHCSNVKFPLITTAAMQFHARAYPALIDPNNLVDAKTYGNPNDVKENARAQRIRNHMTFQNIEQNMDWEDAMDKALLALPIMGCAFIKSFFDQEQKIITHDYVAASDLIVDYWTKTIDKSQRVSHFMYYTRNELKTKQIRGLFLEYEDEEMSPAMPSRNIFTDVEEEVAGKSPTYASDANPFPFVEQQCFFDLDGDGYAEPYLVTFREDTKQLYRIVANFFMKDVEWNMEAGEDAEVMYIKPQTYFTKITFIPSPVNAFYDMGFGQLLGPINNSVDTLINQLIDAGTMSTTGGGFLGRGINIKSGNTSFVPWEWKRTDSTGEDLRKSIFPLPVKEPSNVLLQLLELLINYGERIGSSVDLLSGIMPGQNTKAETVRTGVEQGTKILSAIFLRVYRGLKKTFVKQFELNTIYFDYLKDIDLLQAGESPMIMPDDYKGAPVLIRPAANPAVVSDSQRMQQAAMLENLAKTFPGFNMYEVIKNVLAQYKIQEIEKFYPDPKGPNAIPPQPNPKVQIEQMRMEDKEKDRKFEAQMQLIQLQTEAQLNDAKVMELQAKAINLLKDAESKDVGHQIALIELEMGERKRKQSGVMDAIKALQNQMELGAKYGNGGNVSNVEGKSSNQEVSGGAK